MPVDIYLYNRSGSPVLYQNVDSIETDTPTEGVHAPFTYGELVHGMTISLDFSSGDMSVSLPSGYLLREATIEKPSALVPSNIRSGVTVAGIVGNLVPPINQSKNVTLDFSSGDMTITPDNGYTGMSLVSIPKPSALTPENIASGVEIAGIIGTRTGYAFTDIVYRTVSGAYGDPNITSISSYMLYGFSELTSLAFPVCTFIGASAFAYCTSLSSVDLDWSNFDADGIGEGTFQYTGISEFKPLNGVAVKASAFQGCRQLQEVWLRTGSEYADASAYVFDGCYSLRNIKQLYSGSEVDVGFKFGTISTSAMFRNCSLLSSVRLAGNGICVIPEYTFQGCRNLVSVHGESTSYIDLLPYEVAFSSSLASSSASNAICIGYAAFENCINLSVIYLSFTENVYISAIAFRNCSTLQSLYIKCGQGVSASNRIISLPNYVFDGTPMSNSALIGRYGSIYISPSSRLTWFKTRPGWSAYSARMVGYNG